VTDSSFASTKGDCLRSLYYSCNRVRLNSVTIVLLNNQFRCQKKHVHLDWGHCSAASVTLHQNVFQQNTYYDAVVLILANVPLIRVTENTFVDLQGGALSLTLSGAVDPDIRPVVISDNVIRSVGRERLESAVSVNCILSTSAAGSRNISLTRNEFYFNLATATLRTSCAGLMVTENVFVNPGASRDYEVRVQYGGGTTMFAAVNYWNATTFDQVADRIHDYADDENLAVVQASPWYLDLNRTQTASGEHTFFKGPFEIGGRIESNITLASVEQPYRVTQHIIIPLGLSLVIEAGVKLLFADAGITVEGIPAAAETIANFYSSVLFSAFLVDSSKYLS